jgi:L,D-peptidoglycan transpeptidase YkuD (ErfK/YbiS/YcfS/YnhG family)
MRVKPGASGPPCSRLITILRVRPSRRLVTGGRSAILTGANLCVLSVAGRSGIGSIKREGDGKTPHGRFRILGGHFRSDRLARIRTRFALKPIRRGDSWCDDPGQPVYNRLIRLPSRGSAENMWRQDHAYDLVLVLEYNYTSRVKGRGSAIFFHLWRSSAYPTEGCIAVAPHVMRRLLPRLSSKVILSISL